MPSRPAASNALNGTPAMVVVESQGPPGLPPVKATEVQCTVTR